MSNHTPGPWVIYDDGHDEDTASDIIMARVGDENYDIAEMSTERPLRERKANAALIAAAPDLLTALTDLLNQLDGIGIPDWHGAEGLSLEQARAAITKAEGRRS